MTTPSVTGTPQAFAFSNGNSPGVTITYTGGGTADSSTWDVLFVNSDTVVSTPSGWALNDSAVGGQGAYVFSKNGGTSSATIITSGNFATDAFWIRITGSSGVDTGATSHNAVDGSNGSTTPSLTTPTLGSSTDLALAFAALHSGVPTSTTYTWSSGYTEQVNGSNTSTGSVAGSVAVKVPAGTAAETPNVTWTGGATPSDRYIFFLAFSPAPGGGSAVAPNGLAVSVALGQPALTNSMDAIAPTGLAVTKALGTPTLAQTFTITPNGVPVTVALGQPTLALGNVAPNGVPVTVALGQPTLTWSVTAVPTGIAVSVGLGQPTVAQNLGGAIAPTGISIPVSLGTPTVAGQPYVPTMQQGS